MKARLGIACMCLLWPVFALACGLKCEHEVERLVIYRADAISSAFGDLYGMLPNDIPIKFIARNEPEYDRFAAGAAYDADEHVLLLPREFILMRMPEPWMPLTSYWPYYQEAYNRQRFPIVEAVDNVLWGIYLNDAARAQGLAWPHAECHSVDIGERLACEMLTGGAAECIKNRPLPLFNANRLDRILPSNFAAFRRRVLRTDSEYHEVQRYGGLLLVGPIVTEFGVARALAYMAQTPFHIEHDDLRGSVERYQQRARKALAAGKGE